jgi:hypothetical protein
MGVSWEALANSWTFLEASSGVPALEERFAPSFPASFAPSDGFQCPSDALAVEFFTVEAAISLGGKVLSLQDEAGSLAAIHGTEAQQGLLAPILFHETNAFQALEVVFRPGLLDGTANLSLEPSSSQEPFT